MLLTLLRHARAADREDWHGADADRPLTAEGIATASRMARALRDLVEVEEILTSPYLRARHTAELFAASWKVPLAEVAWLEPAEPARPDPVGIAAVLPRRAPCLVGHEPDLGALCGWLVGGPTMPLKKCGLVVLEGQPRPRGMQVRLWLSARQALALADG